MNRFLQMFNLLGILVLAVLCVIQWQVNSRVNLRANQLELVRQAQAEKLDEDDRTIKGQASDLEEFRQRLTLAESQLKDLEAKLNQITAERNELKAALPKWMAAVSERDAAIKRAGAEIQKLAKERNDAIEKLNDVVTKYNALVKGGG